MKPDIIGRESHTPRFPLEPEAPIIFRGSIYPPKKFPRTSRKTLAKDGRRNICSYTEVLRVKIKQKAKNLKLSPNVKIFFITTK